MSHHPGGKFVLKHLVGTDISKFFYGGYSLEDNALSARGHNHSNQAKMIANDIAMAIYEKDIEVCQVQVDQEIKECQTLAQDVHLVVLCAEKPVSAFKLLHSDFRIFGKHFRVFNNSNKHLSRHYTICNAMNPVVYKSYIAVLKQES